ncbi:hypothetical protein FD754_008710, partial [Muntiacus muntjak]
GSSSSDSLEGQSCDYASKSYDAVVFDVLKVTPEEFAPVKPFLKEINPEYSLEGLMLKLKLQPGSSFSCDLLSSFCTLRVDRGCWLWGDPLAKC